MNHSTDIGFDGWTLHGASGEVVTREQLIARLWPSGVVDFETSLNTAVRKLRAALGDEADTPRYIETLPRKGYRFIGTISAPSAADMGVAPPPAARRSKTKVALWILIGVLLVGAGIAIAPSLRQTDQAASGPITSLAVLPFRPLLPESRNPALEFGMADTLITQLSNLPGVKVSPLSAVRPFDATGQDPLAAGRSLQVLAVLDGSIQTDRQRVRVSARLLRVADGSALWSSQFDEPVS